MSSGNGPTIGIGKMRWKMMVRVTAMKMAMVHELESLEDSVEDCLAGWLAGLVASDLAETCCRTGG